MKLDEAIKHEEEIANGYERNAKHIREKMKSDIALSNADDLDKYAKNHRQIAEWLKELKKFREQEPFINKPCVSSGVCEHDKQKILDKIRAEIDRQEKWLLQAGYTAYNVDIAFDTIKAVLAESEGKE